MSKSSKINRVNASLALSFGLFVILTPVVAPMPAQAEDLKLIAAGSLKAALGEASAVYAKASGHSVKTTFGPSGLMRKKIEAGEQFDVFASANMKHPKALEAGGMAGPVVMFARNSLCALAQSGIDVTTGSLLETMLKSDIRLGTSTPKADPSGDYAFQLFDKADKLVEGSTRKLKDKSLQLTGGPDSPKPPEGRNTYAWVMQSGKADIFLTYCTNAVLAEREFEGLQIINLPDELNVGASYGLTVLKGASSTAAGLADFIAKGDGQKILQSYGFKPPN